jgi:hypothetical protein
MSFRRHHLAPLALGVILVACGDPGSPNPGSQSGARSVPAEAALQALIGPPGSAAAKAEANYDFFIPADFNGGIFGIDIDNRVRFNARRDADGVVSGHYDYTQSAGGQDFIFSGVITCFQIYDTPVLVRFPLIPAMTQNRAKWGGLIVESNDPTQPPGRYIWFQSIDNGSFSDVSTLSGFGTEAANEAFCASPNVPNPNFGPHALTRGNVLVN